jgi:uncharacterized damage-inducible protein DinB
MRKKIWFMLTLTALSAPLPAADAVLSKDQRARAIQWLEDSRKEFLAAVDGLSGEQWNFKPAPDRWSVGEVAEHIMLAEGALFARVEQALAAKPNPDWEKKTAGKSAFLEQGLLNRTHKAQAPETIVPKGNFTRAQIMSRYAAERAKTLEFIRKTELPLNEHTAEHPFPIFNTLSAYQWVIYIPLHNLRHNQQIAEVKATAGYPK